MQIRLILFLVLAAVSVRAEDTSWTPGALKPLGSLPGGATAWEREVSTGARALHLSGISFSAKDYSLRVIDNPPDARKSLASALADGGAVGGVNGGYFHKDFTPLGLVVANGVTIHAFERAKLLSGILTVQSGRMEILRATSYKEGGIFQEALQAGPWLVERGAIISGLNAERPARRTVVVTDGKENWAVLVTSPITLAETAQLLALKDLAGNWTVRDALNLDGGSSTMLLAMGERRPLVDIPAFGPVRNYLAIVPRH